MRTTLDIDDPILRDLKKLQKKSGQTLGRVVSDLLAKALADAPEKKQRPFAWRVRAMGRPSVDLLDKEAVAAALDEPRGRRR